MLTDDVPCGTTVVPDTTTTAAPATAASWWRSPYLLGSAALLITATLSLCFSLLLVCRRLHHFHYCSLFLVEMAVGCITTEAIVHLIPALILSKKPRTPSGMPVYFPRLAVVTASVCVLHALDTASIVFFGRRQSTSHAMEWRRVQYSGKAGRRRHLATHNMDNSEQKTSPVSGAAAVVVAPEEAAEEEPEVELAMSDSTSSTASVHFEDDGDDRANNKNREITLREVLANPRLCLQPGPHRLCSILTAGAVLHSFADGVAIGAAFVQGWESGLHLSLSVGAHELAHKVADFAVLTASGFSLQAVVLLNACYWTAAFVGLFVSVPLSQRSADLNVWIMTIATAVFVYISLVTMSSMVRRNYSPQHVSAFIIGNAGMTTGFIVIILASVLEFYYA